MYTNKGLFIESNGYVPLHLSKQKKAQQRCYILIN
jgi:hypothetical protein